MTMTAVRLAVSEELSRQTYRQTDSIELYIVFDVTILIKSIEILLTIS